MRRIALLLALVTPALGAGCNSIMCGEGTYADGDTCIGWDPNDRTAPTTVADPPGTRSRAPLPSTITLTSDENARIFFTTDGTDPDPTGTGETSPVTVVEVTQGMTLKWFAVDRAGNQEAIQQTVYDSDTTPPSPPSGFAVTVNGTNASVAWTAPTDADYAGVAVARVDDVADVSPTDGMMISPGMLSSSVQVLQAGMGTSVSDSGLPPGPIRYIAWAYDDLGNYSSAVAAVATLPIGSLTGQLTYDTTAMTLAMPTTPANISLAGTTATLNGTTLTISLALTNNTAKYFHNFKAEVTAQTNASFSNSDGTADTFPFKSYGPRLFAPGATVTRDLTFTVTPGQNATINFTLADHATIATTQIRRGMQINLLDSATGAITTNVVGTIEGPNENIGGRARKPTITGQRYLDVPLSHGAVERFDLVTGMRVGSAAFGIGEKANTQWVYSTGAELVALVKRSGNRDNGKLELLRIDEGLKVRQTIELVGTEDQGFSLPALAPDGHTLALIAGTRILMVDLNTFKQVDANPATPAIDNISSGVPQRARGPVFFNNGNGMLTMAKYGGQVGIARKTANGWTATTYQDSNTQRGYHLGLTDTGKIWVVQQTGIREFDPSNDTFSNIGYPNQPQAVNVLNGQTWVTRVSKSEIDQVSPTGSVLRTISLPGTQIVGHWLAWFR